MRGGPAEPLRRRPVVGLAVDAFSMKHGEIVHGLGVALLGRGYVERSRFGQVLLDAVALLVDAGEPELGWREARVSRAFQPAHRLFHIARNAASLRIARGDLVFGAVITTCRSRAQYRTE